MQYQMRQKLFAWGDDFTIKTADGTDAFFVDGKVFSLGHQLAFQDMAGHELAYIRQKLLAWGPTYELYREGSARGGGAEEALHLPPLPLHDRRTGPGRSRRRG